MMKIPLAWKLIKSETIGRMSALAAATAGAAKIAQQDIDVSEWALSITEKFVDQHHKAMALSRVARALSEAGLDDQAMRLLLAAFMTARLAGRETVLEVLADGAEALAKIDQGETLLQVYDEFLAVDHWLAPVTGPPECRVMQ